jgi:hypothetical protein
MTRMSSEPTSDADVVEASVEEPDADVGVDGDPDEVLDAGDADVDALPPLSTCEPEARLSGEVAPPNYFACSPDVPQPPRGELPYYLGSGQLCSDGAGVAWFTLGQPSRAQVGLLDYSNAVILTVMDSEARVVTQIGPGQACVEVDLEAGAVGLAAEPAAPPVAGNEYFEFYVDLVEEPAP